jgi:TolB-like protein/DNA-binding winged helix-turn-helix (wHTH) protein/Tfp pilus assembly protein PilF
VAADGEIRFGRYRLHPVQGLFRGNQEIHVTPKSLSLLHALAARAGEVVTKDELFERVWPRTVVTEASLATCIQELRTALDDDARDPRYIETVHRRGYRFVADVVAPPARVEAHEHAAAIEPRINELRQTSPAFEPPQVAPGSSRRPALFPIMALAAAVGVAALLTYGGFTRWWAARESAAPSAHTPATAELSASTVAVLPFENQSTDAENAFVAFGVGESVLHRLAGIHGLTVIARTSSFALGQHLADARDIGRKLNARYLVEGSVQRSGERLRVTAQLIDASTGGHLWSLRFDRTVDDIFAVEDEIARNIATALDVTLNSQEHPYAAFGTDAYLAYLEGRALVATSRVEDAERAIRQFSQAIQIAPRFAAAYAALADARWQVASLQQTSGTGYTPMARSSRQRELLAEGVRAAQPLLEKALQLDDTLAEAYVLRADLKATTGDLGGAEDDYRKALALNPSYGTGHQRYGHLMWRMNRHEEARAEVDQAIRVDPLSPRNYYDKGMGYLFNEAGGVFTEAENYFLKALAIAPDYHPALLRLGVIRWYQGRFAEAVMLTERALAIDPQAEWIRRPLAEFYLDVGEVDAAHSVLLEAPETVPAINWLAVCLYERHPARAADLLRAEPPGYVAGDQDVPPYVLRDAALASGRLEQGRGELLTLPITRLPAEESPFRLVTLAQVSLAMGSGQEAERLARKMLDYGQSHGRVEGYRLTYPKAAALTLLGRSDSALVSLEEGFEHGYRRRWWYAFERDPAFDALRSAPRFQALAAKAEAHAAAERESLQRMRERGQVPKRALTKTASAGPC